MRTNASALSESEKTKLFIDYDGTLVQLASFNQPPTSHLTNLLTSLAADEANTLSSLVDAKKPQDEWFGKVPNISLVANTDIGTEETIRTTSGLN